MVVSSKLRTHKVMEAAIRALMGAGTPPFFKFGDTYASIEFPDGYTVPAQATLEAKYNELLALENDIQATVLEGDLEVGTSNLFVDTTTGRVGVGTDSPSSLLTVNAIPDHRSTYDHSEAPLTSTYTATPTSNTTLNDPKSVLHLAREGTNGQSYGARASFKLSRYENNDVNSRTRLDLNLAHAGYDDVNVMTMRSDGNVGIGKTNPSNKLDVVGDIYATGNITGYSDKRAKSDIQKIENALEKLEQINGYTFTMNDKRYTGVIAQEVLPVLPEAVTGSEETHYAVAYGNMMGLIIEAIKELKKKVEQ